VKSENQKEFEFLQKAFAEYQCKRNEKDSDVATETPSRDFFEFQLQEILKKSKRARPNPWKNLPRRAAALAAAFLIVFSTAAFAVHGKALLNWVTEFYETNVKIYFTDEDVQKAPATIETFYMPTYIPDGYELDASYTSKSNRINRLRWKTEDGNYIQFRQSVLDGESGIDIESSGYSEFYHNDTLFIRINKHGTVEYVWHTNKYFFLLAVYPQECDEEIWKIIDSIEKNENIESEEFLQ